jgi:isopentenyl-diphosphate Delta-isomerase
MPGNTNQRKRDHLRIIREDGEVDRQKHYFDQIQLTHRALPEVNLSEIDTRCEFLGKTLAFPLLISSMTGGDSDELQLINRNLATAAERCRVAMGVGSQRVMMDSDAAADSFRLRDVAPNTVLCANLGAVQLNMGFSVEECRKAVECCAADALFLHLNPLQEAVQPEGDTDFSDLAKRIGAIASELEVPVIVKEVGAGISKVDAERLLDIGVSIIDVAGSGGTSWSRVESHRRATEQDDIGVVFQDWGIPTPQALWDLLSMNDELTVIASGGIRNGIDMAKAVILGASLCGLASPFLKAAHDSPEAVEAVIEKLKNEFKVAMFLLGCANMAALQGNVELIAG